jgi:hypothetical protein
LGVNTTEDEEDKIVEGDVTAEEKQADVLDDVPAHI